MQIAATLAWQLTKGVEGGLDAFDAYLRIDGEVDGGWLCTQYTASEVVTAGLIGDEGFYLLDVLHTRKVGHLKAVGLDDSLAIGLDRHHAVFDEFRQIHFQVRHQQMVGGVDDGAWSLVLATAREAGQFSRLQVGDIAGEGLQGVDVAFAAYLGPFGAEVIDHHVVSVARNVQFAAIALHVFCALLLVGLRVVVAHLHHLREVDLGVGLVVHLKVVAHIEIQAELEYQVIFVVVVVAELLVVAGGE